MTDAKKLAGRVPPRTRMALSAAALLAIGAAGGAGAVQLTRPGVEMAPTVPTAIARLPQASGIVTVKGRVAETYGNQFVVQDGTGRTLVDAGRHGGSDVRVGSVMTVQGRYDDGRLRASYLVDPQGRVDAVGAPPPPPPHGGPGAPPPPPGAGAPPPPPGANAAPPPGAGAPPPPPGGPGAPPPPPPGAGAPPPPPAAGAAPPAPPAGTASRR